MKLAASNVEVFLCGGTGVVPLVLPVGWALVVVDVMTVVAFKVVGGTAHEQKQNKN